MWALAEALSRFNRTEPDLLFRDAFGHSANKLQLSSSFRKRIEETAGLSNVPQDAWWATEYPFNSLAGALLLYAKGESSIEQATPNRVKENLRNLAENGREDVDFIVSYDNTLILIEAKAFTSYKNTQMTSKLARLELVYEFYQSVPNVEKPSVDFHFLLTSPTRPQRLQAKWPTWACKGKIPPWMPLQDTLHPDGVLRVTRCDGKGKTTARGEHWRVTKKAR